MLEKKSNELFLSQEQLNEFSKIIPTLKCVVLNSRQLCDIELLLNGGFYPLTGFNTEKDYNSILTNMRLTNGTVWPIPVTLDVSNEFADSLVPGEMLLLEDFEGDKIALMQISDIYKPDIEREANMVYSTNDIAHAGVSYLSNNTKSVYLGGTVFGIKTPKHYDFTNVRLSPSQLKTLFSKLNWGKVIGFQTRNPMHRAHQELTLQAMRLHDAKLLINPVVGMTKPGDIDHYTRVRCYQKLLSHYPDKHVVLNLLPLAMRMAGPREALWHAIIRRNHGCTHFIVGRDHAGPGPGSDGVNFYKPYDAQELVKKYEREISIELVPFHEMVYVKNKNTYIQANKVEENDVVGKVSGTEFRRCLAEGGDIPSWFSYPDIIHELQKSYPPRETQGFTLFFTGLSGAGKSTIANIVMSKLMAFDGRPVTLLDGDHVRKMLSSELGFSKEHRDLNIKRIGYVASEITKHRGIAICAQIAPYQAARNQVRQCIDPYGGFIEIYIATPLSICEKRDRKGLYAKARKGLISDFTGIDDPYEVPERPDIIIDTQELTASTAADKIISKIQNLGYLRS